MFTFVTVLKSLSCYLWQIFFGICLRKAGCPFGRELDRLSENEIYSKICVDHIMKYDCPNTLMCSINCASEGAIDRETANVIPFNNYGEYDLRIRVCDFKVHTQQLERYANVVPVPCRELSDFIICETWVPSLTFIPVAIPKNTTYIEVDNCETLADGSRYCHVTTAPLPTRVYGNDRLFTTQYTVAQSNVSICATDGMYILISILSYEYNILYRDVLR